MGDRIVILSEKYVSKFSSFENSGYRKKKKKKKKKCKQYSNTNDNAYHFKNFIFFGGIKFQ